MYSKIAENSTVDRDTIAQFEKEDFMLHRISMKVYKEPVVIEKQND